MLSIAVVGTGGTIASERDAAGRLVVALGVDQLLQGIRVPAGVSLSGADFMRSPSFTLAAEDVLAIAQEVRDRLDRFDGVVVTHGTDTLEETSFLLGQTLPLTSQVVVTGAQRSRHEPDWDGPRNLADAVAVAACPVGLGPTVVLGGVAVSAVEARKVHTSAVEAFSGGEAGVVALVNDGEVQVLGQPTRGGFYAKAELPRQLPRVDLVKLGVGADGLHVRASTHAGAQGLVVEAFGSGNVTADVLSAIRESIDAGVVVAICSRTGAGRVRPAYGQGGGADVADAGAVFAGDLTGPRARVALALALAIDGPQQAPEALREMIGGPAW